MADIELVIKIPEHYYENNIKAELPICLTEEQVIAILPKGHGRLIDADELTKEIKSYISDTSNLHYNDLVEAEAYNSAYYNCLDEIEDAATIIEAESEGKNG